MKLEENFVNQAHSIVLGILKLLTPAGLSRLASTRSVRIKPKMAAGAELLVWDQEDVPSADARVLEFPANGRNSLNQIGILSAAEQQAAQAAIAEAAKKSEGSETDFILGERVKFKDTEDKLSKQNGLASYQKSSDMALFRVTVTDAKGKERSQLTSSQGVLVNKKQA
jgi:hypothetical protein